MNEQDELNTYTEKELEELIDAIEEDMHVQEQKQKESIRKKTKNK